MLDPIHRALGLLLLALAAGIALHAQESSPPSTADARIAFYKQRLGGPGTYPAYARLGAAYIQKARETGKLDYYQEAERQLRRSLKFQRNFEALLWLGVTLFNQHRFQEALPFAREAVETLPASVEAQAALFDVHLALGDEAEAGAALKKLTNLQPGFAASARAANLRQYQGNMTGALEYMERACAEAKTESVPAEAQAWCLVRLGSLRLSACELGPAEAAYNKALGRFPDYPLAFEHLAELRAAQGRAAEAVILLRKLLAANPDPHLRLALADVLENSGQQTEADQERRRALVQMQESVRKGEMVYLRPLALLLLDEPRTAHKGLRLAEKDWENRRDVFAADSLAWAYYVNGRRSEARELIDETLRGGSREPALRLHAAEIYLAMGEEERARLALEPLESCPSALLPGQRAILQELRSTPGLIPKTGR